MGRKIKRVPVDFDWPLNKVWDGYLMPDSLDGTTCADCDGSGSAPGQDNPTACWPGAPGHAPGDGPPWESWFVPDNGMPGWRRDIVQAADVPRAMREHETWTRVSRERAGRHGLVAGRYELRPPGDHMNG